MKSREFTQRALFAAIAASAFYALPAQASDVSKVQLGIQVAKSGGCPRDATIMMWAHKDGPGGVKFVIHGKSGSKTGQFPANAVKGPAGNYLATRKRTITISTDVDTAYRLEEVGSGKFSNWVPLIAECGPKPRKTTTTTSSGAKPPTKKASDPNKPQPRKTTKTTGSKGKPPARRASNSEPKPDTKPASKPNSKPNSKPVCKPAFSVTRHGAYTKVGGIETARIAWRNLVQAKYGFDWRHLINAKDRSETCKRKKLLLSCTVSARPCKG